MKLGTILINRIKNNITTSLCVSIICTAVLILPSCKKYLDIVPDNVATIDNAFGLRNEAEKYLFSCYSFLPKNGSPLQNVSYLAGDEMWVPNDERELISYSFRIARGGQNAANPYMDYWSGSLINNYDNDKLFSLYKGIRSCNIFLENVQDESKVRDLNIDERHRWVAEVKFLKAYYHFYLLRLYGPIPIVDKNIDISAAESQVRIKRMPFDECINYISTLLDEAAADLPAVITERSTQLGRITKPIALAIKAKVWLTAASPLFNGNPDYAGFKDQEGVSLFSIAYDAGKWKKAADAAKEAIVASETAGFKLYTFPGTNFKLSDTTLLQLTIKGALTERFDVNTEHVWANPNSYTNFLQQTAMARLVSAVSTNDAREQLAAPIKIAEMFYSKNGVPINEDKTLNFNNRYSVRTAVHNERFYVKEGYETARLNFDREPRFYADLCFDGGIWYKYDSPSNSDENTFVLEGKSTQLAGAANYGWYNETGYFIKKVVDWNMTNGTTGASYRGYPWPEIRLADIYLMYAEALNESTGPSPEVYEYLNKIRVRAGLETVEQSWTKYSSNPNKYTTQDGLRQIIHQERGIELAFEGSRYWDLRRWKTATEVLNQPITGWSVYQPSTAEYYHVRTIFSQNFVAPRDYLWPIKTYDLTVNPKLVQNPGW